ncbi:CCA tRNA nucleotidyltransferase [Edaphobacter sp. 12200R-103]|uniref:CCA tRNA nucleotidyltransferase n=1 Tax=Edaphobacter sp. 12200R-103 TaxID=2703788 RepID=UPI00138BDC88|nr:CCA tRNA nucleotidyltransferase [Edaphobacter sp. 12200R-103]QHS51235.1 CCA tRNA nucleotidyltransferase [Edaphobacter sp. 12200R-103]
MADYIYLLENRLSKAQRDALEKVKEVSRTKGLTLFLVGGAVRDLTSGSPVRDLDVVVQGNALKLKKDIDKSGGKVSGEAEATQSFFVDFPGNVRMEIGSTLTVSYPKPGKPVYKPATILEDLRRRDFTANAMALSLNEGSYGLLMDPLNGVADIENRELRLVNNYGFIEDPVQMIRAVRFMARLGWQMDERTRSRYETGKEEGYIAAMSAWQRGYETEEIFYEEEPLRVLGRLESEGWMKHLNPAVSTSRANANELEKLRDAQLQLQIHGIYAEAAAANFPLLTAKMAPKEVAALKNSFIRKGFVQEIDGLEAAGKAFAAQLSSKEAAKPSQAWKLLHSAAPTAVLWAAHHVKTAAVQNKLKNFYTEWPQARQRIPYVLMQEMRITPDLPGYDDLLEKLFFELMDNHLSTTEEQKAFLEPYSPPAPPPPVNLRRARGARKEPKAGKGRKKAASANEEPEGGAAGIDTPGALEKPDVLAAKPAKPAKPVKAATSKTPDRAAAAKKAPLPPGKTAEKKPAPPAKKAAPAKKSAPPPAKKTPAKAVVKKAAPKKEAKKAPAKKPVAKKAPIAAKKVAPAKKAAAKKLAAKAPAKKAVAKKASAKAKRR